MRCIVDTKIIDLDSHRDPLTAKTWSEARNRIETTCRQMRILLKLIKETKDAVQTDTP